MAPLTRVHHLLPAAAAVLLLGAAAQPSPQAPAQQAAGPDETLSYADDAIARMTVPVTVAGQGPFHFVVDTGAERTVVSRALAQQLSLAPSTDVLLASIVDVQRVPTVIVPELVFGRRRLEGVQAPVLEERYLGARGILGVDSLVNQQLILDFGRREMRLSRSVMENSGWAPGTIVVTAQTRLGRMILANASVDGQRITVVVDTGSAITIGNGALRRRLLGNREIPPGQSLRLISVTGASVDVTYTRTRRLQIGEAGLRDLPIAFADLHLFRELGLEGRPALLLGMDVMQRFSRVSIDFAHHRLRLMPQDNAATSGGMGLSVTR